LGYAGLQDGEGGCLPVGNEKERVKFRGQLVFYFCPGRRGAPILASYYRELVTIRVPHFPCLYFQCHRALTALQGADVMGLTATSNQKTASAPPPSLEVRIRYK